MIIGASSFAGTIEEIKGEVGSIELYIPKLELYKNLQLQNDVLDSITDALSTCNLVTSIHAPYFADVPTYPKELVVDTANMGRTHFRLMEESIELASRLDSKVVVVHPGRINGNQALSFSRMIENLKELASFAHDRGVMLGLENKEGTDPGNLCCGTNELLEAIRAVDSPNLGVTFDVGHANLTCGGVSDKVRDFAKDLAGHVVHIHLHDNTGVWTDEYAGDVHMAPGSGNVDFSVINEISDYRGIYNLEVFSIDDVVSGKNVIDRMLR